MSRRPQNRKGKSGSFLIRLFWAIFLTILIIIALVCSPWGDAEEDMNYVIGTLGIIDGFLLISVAIDVIKKIIKLIILGICMIKYGGSNNQTKQNNQNWQNNQNGQFNNQNGNNVNNSGMNPEDYWQNRGGWRN